MKKTDVFRRIVLTLAVISFIGCSSNKSEKKDLKNKTAVAEAKAAESNAVIADYQKRLAETESLYQQRMSELDKETQALKKKVEEADLKEQKWANESSDRLIQLKNSQERIEDLSFEISELDQSKKKLANLVRNEKEKLSVEKENLKNAKALVRDEILNQKELVEENKRLMKEARDDARNTIGGARVEAESIVKKAEGEAALKIYQGKQVKKQIEEQAGLKAQEMLNEAKVEAQTRIAVAEAKENEAVASKTEAEERLAIAVAAEQILQEREAGIVEYERSVDEWAISLARMERNLKAASTLIHHQKVDFIRQVDAARRVFIEKGNEKIFDGMLKGKKYPFLVTIVGTGDYKNLKTLRKKLKKTLKGNKYEKYASFNPVTVDFQAGITKKDKSKIGSMKASKKTLKLEDGRTYVKNAQSSQKFNVMDKFIVDSTIEGVVGVEADTNLFIENQNKSGEAASFFVSVRPIKDLVVSTDMKISGYKGSGDRRQEKLMKKVTLKDINLDVTELETVDLTDLSKTILGGKEGCDGVINDDCLKYMSKKGLLDTEVESGVSVKDYLISEIDKASKRIELEQKYGRGKSLVVDGVSIRFYKEGEQGWLDWLRDIDYEILNLEEARTDYMNNVEMLKELDAQTTISKIEVAISVKGLDQILDGRVTLDAQELMGMGSVASAGVIHKGSIRERGKIEIELPIKTRGNRVSTNMMSLIMKDFEPSAERPMAVVPPELNGDLNRFYRGLSAARLMQEAEEQKGLISQESYDDMISWAKFRKDQELYPDRLKAYEQALIQESENEYESRLKDFYKSLTVLENALKK